MESAYRRLIEHLQTRALGFPEAPETEARLLQRVSIEEAELLAARPFFPHTLEQLCLQLRQRPGRLVPRLNFRDQVLRMARERGRDITGPATPFHPVGAASPPNPPEFE